MGVGGTSVDGPSGLKGIVHVGLFYSPTVGPSRVVRSQSCGPNFRSETPEFGSVKRSRVRGVDILPTLTGVDLSYSYTFVFDRRPPRFFFFFVSCVLGSCSLPLQVQ